MSQRYRTIVADPPWDHSDGTGASYSTAGRRDCALPYGTMNLAAIKALPVAERAADDALLFLWTTNRYLAASGRAGRGRAEARDVQQARPARLVDMGQREPRGRRGGVTWRYYTEALNQPPAPWPVTSHTRIVTKHTLGIKAFRRYLVITWVWTP